MKRLLLARHAKSSWDYPELDDFERPLNARGRRDVPVMAKRLKQLEIRPDFIWSSPAIRAVMTARIYAAILKFPLHDIFYSEAMYADAYTDLVYAITNFSDTHSQIMLVGHNPVITSLANHLLEESLDNIPTAGVVGISFPQENWKSLISHIGKLEFFEYPKKLKT